MKKLKVTILGGGAWGTAVALAAARHPAGHQVGLWLRDAQQAQALRRSRSNQRYLPGIVLPEQVQVLDTDLATAVEAADLVVLGTPVAALRQILTALQQTPAMPATATLAWLCKGIEPSRHGAPCLLPHEVFASLACPWACAVLSGPSFALEVAQSLPTALVAAAPSQTARQRLVDVFHSGTLRIYQNDDVTGVEVGGAVKNVLALATGICDGMALGMNARAALITRGLAEMTRLGVALGGRPETFRGLSGVGDLVLTATGGLSRNRKVGLLLAEGQSLETILQSLGHVAEGVFCARAVQQRATAAGIEMPITNAVVRMLDGQCDAARLVEQLLERDPAME